MRHINDQTLDQLLADSLDESQERELEAHVQRCSPCAARLREWEMLFPQIRGVAPAGDESIEDAAIPATRSSVVMLPDWTPPAELPHPPRSRPSPLWIVVAALAVAAGWLAVRRTAGEAEPNLATYEPAPPAADTTGGGLGSGMSDSIQRAAFADSAALRAIQTPVTEPVNEPAPDPPESSATPSTTPSTTPAVQPDTSNRTRPENTVQFPVRADSDPTETVALPAQFTRVTLGDAIDRLGGSIRLIDGLTPEAVEIAGGAALPGADPGRLVVRIIYDGPDGRVILDQQRLNRAGSREPDIAVNTAQSGVSVAQWVDWKGYWISLACRTNQESLLAIANRIRESK
ncbi:MAG TPA: hypothetical protein VGP80_12000 [Gemmatimonadales bacterium]|nr:hypothetical protein [Gemmatimonadales bacterium]